MVETLDSEKITETTKLQAANLVKMIELEKAMIDNAPVVKVQMGQVLRCHICGLPIQGDPIEFEVVSGVKRVKGGCCAPA